MLSVNPHVLVKVFLIWLYLTTYQQGCFYILHVDFWSSYCYIFIHHIFCLFRVCITVGLPSGPLVFITHSQWEATYMDLVRSGKDNNRFSEYASNLEMLHTVMKACLLDILIWLGICCIVLNFQSHSCGTDQTAVWKDLNFCGITLWQKSGDRDWAKQTKIWDQKTQILKNSMFQGHMTTKI